MTEGYRSTPEDALDAARTVTAWVIGFIGMELAGAFRLGDDIDRAYEFGIARLAKALGGRGSDGPSE